MLNGALGLGPVMQTINKIEPAHVKALRMEGSAMVTTKKSENVVRILYAQKM